jgi:hypothetical protein
VDDLSREFAFASHSACPARKDKHSVSSPLKKKSKKGKVGMSGTNTKSSRFRADSESAAAGGGGTAAHSSNAGGSGGSTLKLKKGSGST